MSRKLLAKQSFSQLVWALTKRVPKGKVTTYLELAKALKKPRSYRAVGNALHKNPYAPVVPCHRVVRSDGYVGGFASGAQKKVDLLKREGVQIINYKVTPLKRFIYYFKT